MNTENADEVEQICKMSSAACESEDWWMDKGRRRNLVIGKTGVSGGVCFGLDRKRQSKGS